MDGLEQINEANKKANELKHIMNLEEQNAWDIAQELLDYINEQPPRGINPQEIKTGLEAIQLVLERKKPK